MLWEVATQIGLHRFLGWELVKTTRFGGFNDLFLTLAALAPDPWRSHSQIDKHVF